MDEDNFLTSLVIVHCTYCTFNVHLFVEVKATRHINFKIICLCFVLVLLNIITIDSTEL